MSKNARPNQRHTAKYLELSTSCLFNFLVLLYRGVMVGYRECVQQNIGCPTRYQTRLAGGPLLSVATIRRTTDTFLFISHTTNVLVFKFRCNIFIGVRIIKEMPGSVTSGTHCIIEEQERLTGLATSCVGTLF